jgi:hypothetical protein
MMLSIFETETIQEKFEKYHADNPDVYVLLVKLARQWVAAGHSKLGIKTLIERLRWEFHVTAVRDVDGFKINNNYAPYYARKIMAEYPELDGLFETRMLTAV